jgi:hypothetical protein
MVALQVFLLVVGLGLPAVLAAEDPISHLNTADLTPEEIIYANKVVDKLASDEFLPAYRALAHLTGTDQRRELAVALEPKVWEWAMSFEPFPQEGLDDGAMSEVVTVYRMINRLGDQQKVRFRQLLESPYAKARSEWRLTLQHMVDAVAAE